MIGSTPRPGFDQHEPPPRDKITACIHCGLCLDKCPTYRALGTEMDSPRGRIYLMKAVDDRRLEMTPNFVEHMYMCLDCRACETACPSHVQFGDLMEKARGQIERHLPRPWPQRLLRWLVFEELFPHPRRLAWMFRGVQWYQRSGVQRLVRDLQILDVFPGVLKRLEATLPTQLLPPFSRSVSATLPGRAPVTRRVGFFTGCVMDGLFPEVHHASARVLQANGCTLWVAGQQTCCGALHMHAGEREQARDLARRNIAAFEQQPVDAIVNNAAGCGAQLKSYGALLEEDPVFAERACQFSAKVQDIAECLAQEPLRGPLGPVPKRVAYDDPCHLLHAQRIRQQPRDLLQQIPALHVVPVTDADFCCGAAGIYNITHHDVSAHILARKMEHLMAAKPEVIATGNPGCMLQLRAGVHQMGSTIPVVHPIELLAASYQAASQGGV